jgi:thymidine phosphorylase
MTLHTDTPERFARALQALDGAFDLAPEGSRPPDQPLVIDRLTAAP